MITGSMLHDLVKCPHRVALDLVADPGERDPPNTFVELLWERGQLHERNVIEGLTVPFVDVTTSPPAVRQAKTAEAMRDRAPLIYGGRISADDLLGVPDLLRLVGNGYVAGDIKSGNAEEGDEGNQKPKLHYAVQLALYTDILERIGQSAGRRPFVIDHEGVETPYDLDLKRGVRNPSSLWQDYQECLNLAREIVSSRQRTRLAISGHCALCHWNSKCQRDARTDDDLTLVPMLGGSKRDALVSAIPTVAALAACNPDSYIKGAKSSFAGVGGDTLRTFVKRAHLLKHPHEGPYLKSALELPTAEWEIFFDIEDDPFTGLVYLHGFLERRTGSDEERYVGLFLATPDSNGERTLFSSAIDYLRSRPDRVLYYYSAHEQTKWGELQRRYRELLSEDELNAIFDKARAVDLYSRVIRSGSEWPTYSHSIKALATHLGFAWRDPNPSGAASIEWFTHWVEGGDPALRERLLSYNEDDCRATRVLLDGVRRLPVRV